MTSLATRHTAVILVLGAVAGCGGTTVGTARKPLEPSPEAGTGGTGGVSVGTGGVSSSGGASSGGAPGSTGGTSAAGGATYACGGKQLPVPTNHVPSIVTCPTSKVAVTCADGGVEPCGGYPCMSAIDCPASYACTCDGTAFGWAKQSSGNICVPSNCRTDADCASGYCSPSDAPGGSFYGVSGFHCHTCDDACSNDSDCGANGGLGSGYCAYQSGAWSCSYGTAAG